ncbi:MAG: CYTH domain-containing protein [Erysipelotrichaceae bacterium]|nr:CYTH domain-containing protein [Erysipelotrichaceae bacterium]
MKIEKEYKMLINESQFNKLKEEFKSNIVLDQVNHYYDTTPSLYNKKMAVRIREVNNEYIFTLKRSTFEGQLEYEFLIDNLDINDKKIKELLSTFSIVETLKYLGSSRTIRHLYKDEYGELCLDKNTYNNLIDYEVEYELFDPNNDKLEHFKNILKKCDIEYKENKNSKLKRFIDSL